MKRIIFVLFCIGHVYGSDSDKLFSSQSSLHAKSWVWVCCLKNMYVKTFQIDDYMVTSLDRYPYCYIIRKAKFDNYGKFSSDNNGFIEKNIDHDCRVLYGLDRDHVNFFKKSHLDNQDHAWLKEKIDLLYQRATDVPSFKQAFQNIIAMHARSGMLPENGPMSPMIIKPKHTSKDCC